MAVEILRISQWVLGLLHFDAIRLYLGLTELFFLLLLPRMRSRFLILDLTIVYLPSVLNTNDFFPSLVLQNHTDITIDIGVILLI
jgi:hypothetical protein